MAVCGGGLCTGGQLKTEATSLAPSGLTAKERTCCGLTRGNLVTDVTAPFGASDLTWPEQTANGGSAEPADGSYGWSGRTQTARPAETLPPETLPAEQDNSDVTWPNAGLAARMAAGSRHADPELTERILYQAQRYGVSPDEYVRRAQESGQLSAIYADVRRGKALASVVRKATVTSASGEAVDFSGQFYRIAIPARSIEPGAQHDMPVRIYLTGIRPGMLEVAAEIGDGLLGHTAFTPSWIEHVVRSAFARAGQGRRAASPLAALPFIASIALALAPRINRWWSARRVPREATVTLPAPRNPADELVAAG